MIKLYYWKDIKHISQEHKEPVWESARKLFNEFRYSNKELAKGLEKTIASFLKSKNKLVKDSQANSNLISLLKDVKKKTHNFTIDASDNNLAKLSDSIIRFHYNSENEFLRKRYLERKNPNLRLEDEPNHITFNELMEKASNPFFAGLINTKSWKEHSKKVERVFSDIDNSKLVMSKNDYDMLLKLLDHPKTKDNHEFSFSLKAKKRKNLIELVPFSSNLDQVRDMASVSMYETMNNNLLCQGHTHPPLDIAHEYNFSGNFSPTDKSNYELTGIAGLLVAKKPKTNKGHIKVYYKGKIKFVSRQ